MAFQLSIDLDPNTPIDTATKPLRYGKLPEIHHTFRADPKSPNILLSMIFVGAVITTIPALLGLVSHNRPPMIPCSPPVAVVVPRSQSEPTVQRDERRPRRAPAILRVHSWHGRSILHVLHYLEPLPDTASDICNRDSDVSQWQQSTDRSPRTAFGRA